MKSKSVVDNYPYYDVRINIYKNTLAESLWALEVIQNLSEQDKDTMKLLILAHNKYHDIKETVEFGFPPKMTQSINDWIYYIFSEPQKGGSSRKAQMELNWDFASADKGGLNVNEKKIHDSLRQSTIFADSTRGRSKLKLKERTSSVRNREAGLISRHYTSPAKEPVKEQNLWSFFPADIYHEKGASRRNEIDGGVDEAFKKTGAPFIAGASGSIEYDIFDLHRSIQAKLISSEHIEKWIIIYSAQLILGGHHSLSEAFIVAKHEAFNYFQDIADPRENYAAFIHQLSLKCEHYTLYSQFFILSVPYAIYLTQKGLINLTNSLNFHQQNNPSYDHQLKINKITNLLRQVDHHEDFEALISEINNLKQDFDADRKLRDSFEHSKPYFTLACDIHAIIKPRRAESPEKIMRPTGFKGLAID